MKSWTEISKKTPEARDAKILDCMWYIGLQIRHKARLKVRGNQLAKSMIGDTYAATPAVRYFSSFHDHCCPI